MKASFFGLLLVQIVITSCKDEARKANGASDASDESEIAQLRKSLSDANTRLSFLETKATRCVARNFMDPAEDSYGFTRLREISFSGFESAHSMTASITQFLRDQRQSTRVTWGIWLLADKVTKSSVRISLVEHRSIVYYLRVSRVACA